MRSVKLSRMVGERSTMSDMGPVDDSPLRTRTPIAWATSVLREPVALLNDHAHLEKKAAANSLALLSRYPRSFDGTEAATAWTAAMASIARDEAEHLQLVLKHLTRRGGRLTAMHGNPYAAALHTRIRRGADELLDRLLVSALIEARSCERFEVLAGAAEDAELRALYRGLCASERGHFRVFTGLAERVDPAEASVRWTWFLDEEDRVLAEQSHGPRMHSGA